MSTADVITGRIDEARAAVAARNLRQSGDPLGPWAKNPLAHAARLTHADRPLDMRSAPTLFTLGDLPPYLASGASPDVLLRLPWVARHHGAGLHDLNALRDLVHELGADDEYGRLSAEVRRPARAPHLTLLRLPEVDAEAHARDAFARYADHPGVIDYLARVDRWASTGAGRHTPVATTRWSTR